MFCFRARLVRLFSLFFAFRVFFCRLLFAFSSFACPVFGFCDCFCACFSRVPLFRFFHFFARVLNLLFPLFSRVFCICFFRFIGACFCICFFCFLARVLLLLFPPFRACMCICFFHLPPVFPRLVFCASFLRFLLLFSALFALRFFALRCFHFFLVYGRHAPTVNH